MFEVAQPQPDGDEGERQSKLKIHETFEEEGVVGEEESPERQRVVPRIRLSHEPPGGQGNCEHAQAEEDFTGHLGW